MNKYIVITTINRPTKAIKKLIDIASDWKIIVVGDLKTPHDEYISNSNIIYLSPEDQTKICPEYSDFIGWNTSLRRNIGFIEAYRRGAEVLAMLDDDNIPYVTWGRDILVGREVYVKLFQCEDKFVFDPLSVTSYYPMWHRGFPLERVKDRIIEKEDYTKIRVLVQANLWDGDPDIDAIERISGNHIGSAGELCYYTSDARYMPFDSQNTIIDRSIIPYFMLMPDVGRVDDIWGSYYVQKKFKGEKHFIAYGPATVVQERNEHNIMKDLKDETYGMFHCMDFLNNDVLPERAKLAYDLYQKQFYSY